MSSPFVTKLDPTLVSPLHQYLIETDFAISSPEYTIFSAKKPGLSVTLYQSHKLVIQGKGTDEFVEFYIEPELLKCASSRLIQDTKQSKEHIGVDESGKGDFFGPLCTVAVFANREQIQELSNSGIRDSKTLKDDQIAIKANVIKSICSYESIILMPQKYNELYAKFQNLNHLLGWCHATAIENLLKVSPCKRVIIDQFTNEALMKKIVAKKKLDIELVQRVRAEEDVVVAAASILARDAFVKGLASLEKQLQITLHKGAGPKVLAAGVKILMNKGVDFFDQCAKTHFKTLHDITRRAPTL